MRWGRGGDPPNQDFAYYSRPGRRWRNVFATPWRWRYELLIALALGWPGWLIAHGRLSPLVVAIPATLAAAALALRSVRGAARNRLWCVVLPHRLRVGMIESGVLSWSGLLPGVLWTAPADGGVRIWVWCPAGVDVRAFEAARSQLAASCWAVDVLPRRHPRWSQVVILTVTTRLERQPARSRLL
jgi:hypothetical protein